MTSLSVSGVLAAFQVCFINLTQPGATVCKGFSGSVSGVSGFPRAQACAHFIG